MIQCLNDSMSQSVGYPGRHGARIAPVCAGVLQASYMRKWMTERLKRRKKPAEGPSKEATNAPEPLQPRFYDNEPGAPAAAPVAPPIVESRRPSRAEPEPEPESASAPIVASATGEAKPRTPRRRRSRGGRGGGRSRQGLATPAPAVSAEVDGSAVEASVSKPVVAGKAPTEAVPAPVRPSRGTVVLAIGLPGSGKSSWFKRHNIHPLSSDLLRALLFDDAQEQRFQDLVFSNLRSMLKARLVARRPMNYVDATNLTPHDRSSWIKLLRSWGVRRSEEHTSELQPPDHLVCRLLLEKKK